MTLEIYNYMNIIKDRSYTMRHTTFFLSFIIAGLLFFAGCEDQKYLTGLDNTPPAVPYGVTTENNDGYVSIAWQAVRVSDLSGYNVYVCERYDGKYTLLGTTTRTYYSDRNLSYGKKYYYAVTAYDFDGNESELSYEYAYGISRPEGFSYSISDYHYFPKNAGFDFSTYSVVSFNGDLTDVYFDIDTSVNNSYLVVKTDSDIKDMGITNDIYDITLAPTAATTVWSPTHDVVAIVGHTYVIWTWDNHFAKLRIKSIIGTRIVFDWTYQTLAGEPALRNQINPGVRNVSNQVKIRTIQ